MAKTSTVFVLNGPNLNLLGEREPHIYGSATLAEIMADAARKGASLSLAVDDRQSNAEGQIIDWIHEARKAAAAIIINPGAFTHTSIAIADALRAFDGPKIEVHLSNTAAREDFRRHSHISPAVDGVIAGLGSQGYSLALDAVRAFLDKRG